MKSFFHVLTWSAILLVFGFFIQNKVSYFTTYYENEINLIESYIVEDNFSLAKKSIIGLSTSWENDIYIWYFILDHTYFDNISLYITMLDKSIDSKNKLFAFEYIELIKLNLGNILGGEKLDLDHLL